MKREFTLTLDGTAYKVVVDGTTVLVNGQPFAVAVEAGADRVTVDGTPYDVKLAAGGAQAVVGGITYALSAHGLDAGPERGARRDGRAAQAALGAGALAAIMPGKIIRILVEEGQPVTEGQVVCILEAMKMENELKAPRGGVLKVLHVRPGQDVERGAVLAEIE